jgi:hypothetical protein
MLQTNKNFHNHFSEYLDAVHRKDMKVDLKPLTGIFSICWGLTAKSPKKCQCKSSYSIKLIFSKGRSKHGETKHDRALSTDLSWRDFSTDLTWRFSSADLIWQDFSTDLTWIHFSADLTWQYFSTDLSWQDSLLIWRDKTSLLIWRDETFLLIHFNTT